MKWIYLTDDCPYGWAPLVNGSVRLSISMTNCVREKISRTVSEGKNFLDKFPKPISWTVREIFPGRKSVREIFPEPSGKSIREMGSGTRCSFPHFYVPVKYITIDVHPPFHLCQSRLQTAPISISAFFNFIWFYVGKDRQLSTLWPKTAGPPGNAQTYRPDGSVRRLRISFVTITSQIQNVCCQLLPSFGNDAVDGSGMSQFKPFKSPVLPS